MIATNTTTALLANAEPLSRGNGKGADAVSYTHLDVYKRQLIALWHALLDDEDEWEKKGGWFGAMLGAPVAMIRCV